tara:strand:- start:134 stop:259 length:126 start_codon:yes stop_codon:yes gene_type:complete
MTFSIIIPVYNRPDEIEELLESFIIKNTRTTEDLIAMDFKL